MSTIHYSLGPLAPLKELYPIPEQMTYTKPKPATLCDVVRLFTENLLRADCISYDQVRVSEKKNSLQIQIDGSDQESLNHFAERHQEIFSDNAAYKALEGRRLLEEHGLWNPMAGTKVNLSEADGDCKWRLFPPLGLNHVKQKAILLMHYPPWQVLQQGDFLNCMTMDRWNTILHLAGIPPQDVPLYRTIVDVNPIAAPGSGQSEYPNDYFPIMMASGFFDGAPNRDYIRSMLDLYLNPPCHSNNSHTLPLLVCGSPLYDPQAPGWFRVAYKDQIPADKNGIIPIDVLQAGDVRIRPESERLTPYMVGNHMIAAGVTGKCTDNPKVIPDIRKYEAQDLVCATFLHLCAENPGMSAEDAKATACNRYFQNDTGEGAPNPKDELDAIAICTLAQMDMFFVPNPLPHLRFNLEQAKERCKAQLASTGLINPCGNPIGPKSEV